MNKKIAWIEDDANIIRSVVKPLEKRHGFEIIVFESMKDTLDRIDILMTCDLILLDVIIPSGIDEMKNQFHIGVHLLQKLREMQIDIPVIAFTVISNSKTTSQLKDLGVEMILNKPLLPTELEDAVKKVLKMDR